MNTSNNRRYQETEQKIINAFFHLLDSGKTIDQIFVQDICHTARISRPSFYTHYEDINDMIMKIEKEKAGNIQTILMQETALSPRMLEKYFDYLKENRTFYIAYFSSGDNAHISQPMMDTYLNDHPEHYTKAGMNEERIRYCMTFFSAGLKAAAFRWLNGGCKESSSEMADLIHKLYFLS